MPANVLVAYGTTNAQAGGGDGRPMCRGPACAEGESGRFAKGGIHHVGHPREARPRRTPLGPRRLPRALAAQQPALVLRRGGPRPRVRAACGRRATDDPYRPGRQGDRDRLRRRSVQRADSRTTPRLPARRCGPPPERARARPRRARAASRGTPRAAARRAVGPPRRRSRVRCPPGSGRRHRRSRRMEGRGDRCRRACRGPGPPARRSPWPGPPRSNPRSLRRARPRRAGRPQAAVRRRPRCAGPDPVSRPGSSPGPSTPGDGRRVRPPRGPPQPRRGTATGAPDPGRPAARRAALAGAVDATVPRAWPSRPRHGCEPTGRHRR